MARHVLIVFTNPVEGREDAFNDWYDHTHLREVMQVPGFVSARRYLLSDVQLPTLHASPHRYLAIYEIDTDDLAGLAKVMTAPETAGSMTYSDAADLGGAVTRMFTAVGPVVEAP